MDNISIAEKQKIKKSFEQMKKKLFADGDPLSLKGCMYMTNQQMNNRTATIDLGYAGDVDSAKACLAKADKIKSTEAYRKFAEEVSVKYVEYENKENAYYSKHMYMRINY